MVDEDCGDLKYCLYEIENSKCLPCIPSDMVGVSHCSAPLKEISVVLKPYFPFFGVQIDKDKIVQKTEYIFPGHKNGHYVWHPSAILSM